jgi:GT2 family glycosyltransferase
MELSVIILNWNAAADTVRCVRHITAWERPGVMIWVVDNNSAADSVEVIARECPNVRLIRNTTNLGFAGGNNKGILEALAASETPILLLNNDASVAKKDVVRLLDTLETNTQIGLIGPLLFDAERKERLLSAGGRNPVLHHHSHIDKVPAGGPVHIVEYVPGTVVIGRAAVFHGVGLLDEDYFFSMEIADLCKRARQQGYLSAIDARTRAVHTLSRSSHLRETLHSYYIIRNRFLFIRKFHHKAKFLLYGIWTLYSLALALKVQLNGKAAMAHAIRLGLRDGLQGRFGNQNERVLSTYVQSTGEAIPPQ